MRELKFKAWDVINKVMYPIAFPSWNWTVEWKKDFVSHKVEFIEEEADDKPILLQYTWLKDKNWKEIFIWDIVRVLFDWNIAEIREWQCIIEAISWPHSYMLCNMKWEDFEIIWNIYENKDLLSNK